MPYVKANDIRIHYNTYGNGEPVVLIGGLGSRIHSWRTQIPLYSEHFRVIAFDNRGAGNSDKPDVPYSIELMADDTAELMDSLRINSAYIVGKSMGGMIGQWLAIKYPDKVKKLVLGCTSARRDELGNEILGLGREIATKVGPKAGWLMALFLGYSREYIEQNLSDIKTNLEATPEDPEALTGYIRQSYACQEHEITDRLGEIKCPTLVMYGDRDFICSPERSRELAEFIPNAELMGFEGAGHGFWRERQEDADKAVLDFLND